MKHFLYLLSVLSFLLPVQAHAYTESEKAAITQAETYLSSLSTIAADFIQLAPSGNLVSGKFYLQRPGKMRWQYDPPTPILMLANGDYLIFYDYELDQVSHIPLEDTLAGFLARKTIRFDKDVDVTDVIEGAGSLRITVKQKARPDDGTLTLEFATNPMQLRNMVVIDSVGQETTVALNNARYGLPLDDELFKLDNRFAPDIGGSKSGIRR